MTWQQLDEHFKLVEKLIQSRELVEQLRASLGLKAQNISGMPRGNGVGDLIGNSVVEIVRIESKAEELAKQVAESQKPIDEWIESVEDVYAQIILRLRFIYGLSWKDVADTIGGGNTAESVKMTCYRLFD